MLTALSTARSSSHGSCYEPLAWEPLLSPSWKMSQKRKIFVGCGCAMFPTPCEGTGMWLKAGVDGGRISLESS